MLAGRRLLSPAASLPVRRRPTAVDCSWHRDLDPPLIAGAKKNDHPKAIVNESMYADGTSLVALDSDVSPCRLPPTPAAATCPVAAVPLDPLGDHAIACPRTHGGPKMAKIVEHAWVRMAREAIGPEGQVVPQRSRTRLLRAWRPMTADLTWSSTALLLGEGHSVATRP